MEALAGLGDNVDVQAVGPGDADGVDGRRERSRRGSITPSRLFGADRCMFASNFPVDGMHGTFDDLYSTYDELTDGLDETTRDKLFAGNAERIYGC